MLRACRVLAAAAALLLLSSANADWIADSDENAMLVLRSQAAFQPEAIARAGLSDFDGDIIDLGPDYRARQDANDRALLEELGKRLVDEEHPKVRQDLEILIQSLNDEIETRRVNGRYMLPYYNIHQLIFGSFNALLDPRNDPARYAKALDRLQKYNGSEPGYTPITSSPKRAPASGSTTAC